MTPTIGMSNYARKHSQPQTGNSYTALSEEQLIALVKLNWESRTPGDGETGLDRKVLVPITQITSTEGKPHFFCQPRMALKEGMPVKAEVVTRQAGEDPYVQTYITPEDAAAWGFQDIPAAKVQIVCYSADTLLENEGERSSDCEWEIVTIVCTEGETETMLPLTMARNFLEKPGGTKSVYSAQQFAEAIYCHSQRGIRVKSPS